jgi:hypothetical protein
LVDRLIPAVYPHPAIQRLRLSSNGRPAMGADDQTVSKLSRSSGHILGDVGRDSRHCLLAVSIASPRLGWIPMMHASSGNESGIWRRFLELPQFGFAGVTL